MWLYGEKTCFGGFILAKTKQVIHSYYAVAEFGPKKVQTNFQSGKMFSHYIMDLVLCLQCSPLKSLNIKFNHGLLRIV